MVKILTTKSCFIYENQLSGIPPSVDDIQRKKELNERISRAIKTGKRVVRVGCSTCKEIITEALKIGLTGDELDVFIEKFTNHQYSDLGRSQYFDEKTWTLDVDALLDEIFEVSTVFQNGKVRDHFLKSAYGEVQRRKVGHWVSYILIFNRKYNERSAILQKVTTNVELLPEFIALFADRKSAEKAFNAAVSAGIIDKFGNRVLGIRVVKSAIIQFWEAVSDTKFELTHLRAETERVGETYLDPCGKIAKQFGVSISSSTVYDRAGQKKGKFFNSVIQALNEQ